MSSLNAREKMRLEKLFDMSGGYVLDFSDSSFGNFFVDVVNIDIHHDKYLTYGTSKANKLRAFWSVESDYLVGKATLELIEHAELFEPEVDKLLADKCKEIGNRLLAGNVNLTPLKENAQILNANHLAEQIRRIEQSIDSDPSLAIGTAKELLETCCKTILSEHGQEVTGNPDIPQLVKQTAKVLRLLPEDIPDEAKGAKSIKRLLSNLASVAGGLAEIRNLYGSGHGRHGRTSTVKPRHARLAVGAATTLVLFLFETHQEQFQAKNEKFIST